MAGSMLENFAVGVMVVYSTGRRSEVFIYDQRTYPFHPATLFSTR